MNNEERIEKLEEQIAGLERQLDEMYVDLEKASVSRLALKEIMEEVAKLANQPVGMLFNYTSA